MKTHIVSSVGGLIFMVALSLNGCAHKTTSESIQAPKTSPFEMTMADHQHDFRECYDRFHAKKPHQAGDVVTAFEYNAEGKVTRTSIQSTTLKSPKTEKCLLRMIKKIKFPKPENGTLAQVKYPFKFSDKDVSKN